MSPSPLPGHSAEDTPQVPPSDTVAADWEYTSLALPAACPAHPSDTTHFPTLQEHVAPLVDQLQGLMSRVWLGVAPVFWEKMNHAQGITFARFAGSLHTPGEASVRPVRDPVGWDVLKKEWESLMERDADWHEKVFVLCLSVALDLWESWCRTNGNVPCFHLPLPSEPLPSATHFLPPSQQMTGLRADSFHRHQASAVNITMSSVYQLHEHCLRSMNTPTDATAKQSVNPFKLIELIARNRENPPPNFFLTLARSLVAGKDERDISDINGMMAKMEAERILEGDRENQEKEAREEEESTRAIEARRAMLTKLLQAGQDRMQELKDEINERIAYMVVVTDTNKSICEELEAMPSISEAPVEQGKEAEVVSAKVVPWRIPVEPEEVQGSLTQDLIDIARERYAPATLPIPASITSTISLSAFYSPQPRNGLDSGLDSGVSTPRTGFGTASPSITTASDVISHDFIQGSSKDHVSSFYGTAPKLTFSSAKGKGKELPCTCGPRRNGTSRRKASPTTRSMANLRQLYPSADSSNDPPSLLVATQGYLPYVCLADSHTPRPNLVKHNSTNFAPTPPPPYQVLKGPDHKLDVALLSLWDIIYRNSVLEVYTQQLVTLLEHQGPPVFVNIWAGRGFAVSGDKLVFADDSARTRMRGAGKAMYDAAASPAFQTRVAILAGRVAFSKLVRVLTPSCPPSLEAKPYCLCYLATEIATIIEPAREHFYMQFHRSPVFAYQDASVAFQRNFLRLSGSQGPWSSAMGAAFQHWLRTFKNKWIRLNPILQRDAENYRKLFAVAGGAEAYSMARKYVEAIKAFEPENQRPLWRLETHFCENSFSGLQIGVPGANPVELGSLYLEIALKRQAEHDWLNVMRSADSAILIQPGCHEHYMLRSRARINFAPNSVFQVRQALLDASIALSLRPGDVDITFWRAQVYIRLEKWEEASVDLGHCDAVIFAADASAEFTDKGRRLIQHVAYQWEQDRMRAKQVVPVTPWSGTSGQLPPWQRPGASPPDTPLPAYSQPFFGVYPPLPWGCSTPDCRPRSNDFEDAGYGGPHTELCDASGARILGGILENLYTGILTFSIREYHIENSLKVWQDLVLDAVVAGFVAAKKEGQLECARNEPEAYFIKYGAEHFRESFKAACAENMPEPASIEEATEEFHLSAKEFMDKLSTISPSHLCLCLISTAQSAVDIQSLVMEYEKVAIMPEATLSSSLPQVDWDTFISRLALELDISLDDDEGVKNLFSVSFIAAESLINSTGTDLDQCDGMLAYPGLADFVRSLGGIRIFTAARGCQDCSDECIVRDFAGWATVFVEGLSTEQAILYEDMGDHYFATGYDFESAVDMYSIALTHSFNARVLFRRCLAASATLIMEAVVQARSGTPPQANPTDTKRRDEILRVNVRNLTVAIGLEPGYAALYTHRATALHALGFHVQAYGDLEESFCLDPSKAPVQLLAIDILARQEYRPIPRYRYEFHVCVLERCFEGPSSAPGFRDDDPDRGTVNARLNLNEVFPPFVNPEVEPVPPSLPPKLCYPDPRSACPPHRCTGTTPDVSNYDTLSALLQRAFTLAMTLALAKERPELLAGRQAATLLDFLRYAPWDSWNVAKPDGQMRILRRAAKEVATSFGTGRDSCRAAYGLEAFSVACGIVLEAISTPEVRNPCFCYLSCHLEILSSGIQKLYALAKKLPTEPSRHHKLDVTRFFAHCDLLDKRGVLKFASWERNVKISFVANTIEDCFKQLLADMETTGTKSLRERRALDLPFEQHFSNLIDYVGGYAALEHAYRLVDQADQPDFPSTSAFLAGIGESRAVELMSKPGGADWSRFSGSGVIMKTPQDVSGWAAFIARNPIDADFQPNRQSAIDFFHLGVTYMASGKHDAAIRELSIAALWAVGQEDDLIAAIYLALAACRNFIGTLLHRKEAVADATLGLGHSDDAMLLVCRADALISLGRFPEARKDLELALMVDPDCVAAPEWSKFIAKIPTTLGRSKSGPSRAEQQQKWTTTLSEEFPRESEFAMCGSLAFLSTNFINSSATSQSFVAEDGTTSPAIDSPSSPEDSRPGSPLLPSSITELLPSTSTASPAIKSASPALKKALERLATVPSLTADPVESEDSSPPVTRASLVPASKSKSLPAPLPSRYELESLGLPPKHSHVRPPRPRDHSNRPADLSFSVCPPDRHDTSAKPEYALVPQVEALLTSIFEATHEAEWRKTQPLKMIEFRERCISAIIHGGQDWEKIVVDSAAYKLKAKDVVKAAIVAETDPSKSAAYGMHAWEDGVDEALLLMGFTYSDGDEEQSVDQENPWTGNACICSTLSPAYVVKLQEILAKLSSPPPPAPLRLPPIDVAGLVAQFRISIKDGRLSGGIWRSGPKWKSKVTSLIALFSTQFSDIIAELEAAGEMGRFDQVWPELAREQGGGKTLAMGRVAVIEATYMAPVGYTWTSWLAYIATTSNGYEEGGLAAREALAERRRIMGIEYIQTGRDRDAIAEMRLSLLLDPYNVQTYSDLGEIRYNISAQDYLTCYEAIAESTIGRALTTGEDRIPFLENRLATFHCIKDIDDVDDAVAKDEAELREIRQSILPREEPVKRNGGTVTEL